MDMMEHAEEAIHSAALEDPLHTLHIVLHWFLRFKTAHSASKIWS